MKKSKIITSVICVISTLIIAIAVYLIIKVDDRNLHESDLQNTIEHNEAGEEMKIIFLDIDGVLNSDTYYQQNGKSASFIDESRLLLVKKIVDSTNAKIVLTSSRKVCWEKDNNLCTEQGKFINEVFAKNGLTIFDKTDNIGNNELCRVAEINKWLDCNEVNSYVIFDDMNLNIPEDHFIRTKMHSFGIDEADADKAIVLLQKM